MAEPSIRPEPYVFLSYASAEQDHALAVSDALQGAGIAVWLDRHAIVGGSAWSTAIVRGIKDCAAFLVLGSERAFNSPNVQRELNLAVEENRPLLPLLLEDVIAPDDVRYALAGRQWVILADRPTDVWLPEVLRALAVQGLGLSTAAAPSTPLPTEEPTPYHESVAVYLPTPLSKLIGRERELAEITALLATARLVTLTGPGGTGKTRLALAAAAQVASAYPDGVWFVDLSGVFDPDGVVPAVAVLLDVKESEGRSLAVSLAAYLRRKRLLLVVDNFEQVVTAALALYDLLAEAPRLALLVTSRILLRVGGEQEFAVPPLPPPDVRVTTDPALLRLNPAVQLFLDRAHALRPDLALTDEVLRDVGAICARLDGLPLAIELAAARVKLLSPAQLLARLERRLPLLTGGVRSLPQRQQTLRATIQWSWDLLTTAEQVLFRRLAVFAGGFTLEAAEAVCNADSDMDVLEGLAALVDQSLVRQQEREGEPRFSLLATLQEFALEQLEASGEAAALRRAHATYFAGLVEDAAELYFRNGHLQRDYLQPLEPERDNLLVALDWTLAQQEAMVGLRLGWALYLWFYVSAPAEGQRWLERLLGLPDAAAAGLAYGRTLFGVAACSVQRGAWSAALPYYEAAATSLRVAEDFPFLTFALGCASAFVPPDEPERAQALADEALRLARTVDGGTQILPHVELTVGISLFWSGRDVVAARVHLEEALRLSRLLDADWLTQASLVSLCMLAAVEGRHGDAASLCHEALPLAEAVGDHMGATVAHMHLAQLASSTGDKDAAAGHWRQALRMAQQLGSDSATTLCLTGIAGLLRADRHAGLMVRLLAASNWLRQAGEPQPYLGPEFQAAFDQLSHSCQAALGLDAFAQAWAEGQALSLDEATDLALAELAPTPQSVTAEPLSGA